MGKIRSDGKSHADLKFEKKMQFYELVRGAVARKFITKEKQQKTRSRQRKLKAYDLSSLLEQLPELKTAPEKRPAEIKLNIKRRHTLVMKERNQLMMVMNYPAFQSDPFAAIYQHLQSTQPAIAKNPKRKHAKTKEEKTKKKNSNALKPMEM